MRRASAAALLLLAGCPLPQPLVETNSGDVRVLPPRILDDPAFLTPTATIIPFDPACGRQGVAVTATVVEDNTDVVDDYRWFVDYDPGSQARYSPVGAGSLPIPSSQPLNVRPVPSFTFYPLDFGASVHVLELVVSNGFAGDAQSQSSFPLPWRWPDTAHEVQSHRWVFEPRTLGCP